MRRGNCVVDPERMPVWVPPFVPTTAFDVGNTSETYS
jgi:hypothetical protein